jgi:guanine deaminase
MREAIRLAHKSIETGGGPFGAVVVREGKIIGRGANRVTVAHDPTAHAEVSAIRDACAYLGDFSLQGCELYVNCMPCPMCLGAIYWARIERIYFAATASDAAAIGFDDVYIAEELARPVEQRHMTMIQLLREEALEGFRIWDVKEDKVEY